MIKFLVFFFIFLISSGPAFSSQETEKNSKRPILTLLLKKEPSKAIYSLEAEVRNLSLKNRKISLSFQGTLRREGELVILDIPQGITFFSPSEVKNFSFYLVYKKGILNLSYFRGEGFVISGKISPSLSILDLNVDIKGIRLKELNRLLGVENFPFQGDFRGNISLKGDFKNLLIEGHLEAFGANLEDYKIERVFLNFRGSYPWIYFSDSYALLGELTLDLEGAFNLAKLYNLPYREDTLKKGELKELSKEEIREVTSLRGFLETPASGVFIYRLGSDSFLRFSVREEAFQAPGVKF